MGARANANHQVDDMVRAAQHELARRQVRARFLDEDYFGEGPWNMLLYLYVAARQERGTLLTKEVIAAADVPDTTALRWLKALEAAGEVVKVKPPCDRRQTHPVLSAAGLDRVERALSAMIDAELACDAREAKRVQRLEMVADEP